MPPIDLNRRPTPWWVLDTKRIASIVESGKHQPLSEKDREILEEAVKKLHDLLLGAKDV